MGAYKASLVRVVRLATGESPHPSTHSYNSANVEIANSYYQLLIVWLVRH